MVLFSNAFEPAEMVAEAVSVALETMASGELVAEGKVLMAMGKQMELCSRWRVAA